MGKLGEIDIKKRMLEWIPFALPLAVLGTILTVFLASTFGELPMVFLFGSDAGGLFNSVAEGNLLIILMGSVLANLVFWLTVGAIYEFIARPLMILVGILDPVKKLQPLLPISLTVILIYGTLAFIAGSLSLMAIAITGVAVIFTLWAYYEFFKMMPFGAFPVEA